MFDLLPLVDDSGEGDSWLVTIVCHDDVVVHGAVTLNFREHGDCNTWYDLIRALYRNRGQNITAHVYAEKLAGLQDITTDDSAVYLLSYIEQFLADPHYAFYALLKNRVDYMWAAIDVARLRDDALHVLVPVVYEARMFLYGGLSYSFFISFLTSY